MLRIAQAETVVNTLLDKCAEAEDSGKTQFRGMTYEQGIRAGIEWLLQGGENPLE